MRLLKISLICLLIILTAQFCGSCPRLDENSLISGYSKIINYKKAKSFYMKSSDPAIAISPEEAAAFDAMEKKGRFLYNDVRLDENTVICFLGCSKEIKFRIGILTPSTGAVEHALTDVYLDKVNDEKLISLDTKNNPYVLMNVYPRGGARGVLYWSIIDIKGKHEIFTHPQKIRRFEEPVNYSLEISSDTANGMRVLNIYAGEKAPESTFRWDPLKNEYSDKPDETPATE